jgi:thioredoxin 1
MGKNQLKEISFKTFEKDILYNNKLVIIHICLEKWKSCNELEGILCDIAEEYEGKVDFFKIDYTRQRELSKELQIVSVPTLIFFYKGKEIRRITGTQSKEQLDIVISSLI